MPTNRVNVRQDYAAFLRAKVTPGVEYDGDYAIFPEWSTPDRATAEEIRELAPHLHDYQRFAVTFAVARRRAALFLECGLGKTSIALAWVERMRDGRPAVICAPLAALHEFVSERDKFYPGVPLRIVPTGEFGAWLAAPEGIALVTHHAMAERRDLSAMGAFVLDESSILKSGDGAIAQSLVLSCQPVPAVLALSATPAPNDPTEYATHATFLGYMRSDAEFRARFFVKDGKDWRVKGHARQELPRWLSRFALWMRDPAVYGMPCDALPRDDYRLELVKLSDDSGVDVPRDMFGVPLAGMTMSQRAKVRAGLYESDARTDAVVSLARGHSSIVWATRNAHADALEEALLAAGVRVRQIAGSTPDEERVAIVDAFRAGEVDCIVSKAKVIGHGVNLQRADRMVFAGYDESYEAFHQAVRRAHRQGRTGRLDVFVLVSPDEERVMDALQTKGEEWAARAGEQESEFVAALGSDVLAYREGRTIETAEEAAQRLPDATSDHYWLQHGDCIEKMAAMPAESVDLAVFSPPFSSLFTYSSETADMGNCREHMDVEFSIHFGHFADRLFRVMKSGRVVCLHLQQLVAFRARHGRKGLRDFRGMVVKTMESAGFHYYGEFVIPKNPQAAAIRTKSERLQFAQFKRDSLESSPCLNDYVLEFRKPGAQAVPVKNDVTNEEWIAWASGVWSDIRETDVISGWQAGRAAEDEKHICPLQLDVIRRCVRLWSNPGEVVFTPFLGIGSEAYVAIEQGRVGWGVELKAEYYRQAIANAELAVTTAHRQTRLAL